MYSHYLWVLRRDLPFTVTPDATLCLGHCLLEIYQHTKVNTQRPWPLKVFLHPRLLHFSFETLQLRLSIPRNLLICARMLPVDYCLPRFCVLALLQSECVAGHESHRGKDIQILAIFTCAFFFFFLNQEERFSVSGQC